MSHEITFELEVRPGPVSSLRAYIHDDSVDYDDQRRMHMRIIQRLLEGDVWAWCETRVWASHGSRRAASDWQGNLNLADEADYRRTGYWDSQRNDARRALDIHRDDLDYNKEAERAANALIEALLNYLAADRAARQSLLDRGVVSDTEAEREDSRRLLASGVQHINHASDDVHAQLTRIARSVLGDVATAPSKP